MWGTAVWVGGHKQEGAPGAWLLWPPLALSQSAGGHPLPVMLSISGHL